MADETLRSIYSAADETIAQLDQLHRLSSDRSLSIRLSLDTATARLGDSSLPFEEVGASPGAVDYRGVSSPRSAAPGEAPFVALPVRSTHGGDFGPKVRSKLIAEALAKRADRW